MKAITLDAARFNQSKTRLEASLRRRLEKGKREFLDNAREGARLAASELARASWPSTGYGVHLGLFAIRADIYNVFTTASRVYERLKESGTEAEAKAFYAAYKHGEFAKVREILRTAAGGYFADLEIGPVDPALHEGARQGDKKHVTLRKPKRLVPKDQLEAYIKKVQIRIGKAASGWAACAAKLGGENGVPHWKSTSVHGTGNGDIEHRIDGGKIGFVLINRCPHAKRLISGSQIARALAEAETILRSRTARSFGVRAA
jgi:hypothetical protein